jgi:hypothetical protein
MLKKIEGPENISGIFSLLHDGRIIKCNFEDDALRMEIEIAYLAKRINPGFHMLMVHLTGVKDVNFYTWPNSQGAEPELFTDLYLIFKPELEILNGNYKDGQIEVVCSLHSSGYGYCGGELYLTAKAAEVTDEAGESYSLEELDRICRDYWDDWANKKSHRSLI